ncbi:phage tail protein [Maridesulfovibrio hydrothermalis]|uniref:phage tail protein n=1 Tax=Maridesulfovibrio hydrothermalis TaxID=191026 RepID=UPI0002F5C4EA|nr:phage tail protein [Maridesulfovibrio hydrothermalis]
MKFEKYYPISFKRLLLAISVCIVSLAILLIALSSTPITCHAGDATSFDPTAVAVQAKGASDTPVGGVIPWPHSTVPDGWLECNGQSTAGYPELAAVVGGNVPDLRGEFIRGWDHGRGVDGGRSIKSSQSDAMESHTHQTTITVSGSIKIPTAGGFSSSGFRTGPGSGSSSVGFTASGSGTSTPAGSGSETRPRNVSMMYIIKAR